MPEICSHLARKFSDIYALSSRRFEEVVGEVYRQMGWEVILTPQTRDGGVDLFCLRHVTGKTCIVECKRYAHDRRVGISVIDRLAGVAVRVAAHSAHLVTSSGFSAPADMAAADFVERGIALELVDGHKLFNLLDIYSDPTLTPRELAAIFSEDHSRSG